MKTILEDLDFLMKEDSGLSKTLESNALLGNDGPVAGCRITLAEMKKLLPLNPTDDSVLEKLSKSKAIYKALSWPSKQSKARKLLDEMNNHRTLLILAITTGSRWVYVMDTAHCTVTLTLCQPRYQGHQKANQSDTCYYYRYDVS